MTENMPQSNNSITVALCRIGGIAAILFLLYSILTMIILMVFGGTPKTAIECFKLLESNRLIGLLRLDLLTIFFMPMYYLLFFGIFKGIKGESNAYSIIAILCVFLGITLFLATPSLFSMVNLSDKYSIAATDLEKNQLIAAGEAIIASDMWHGSGAVVGSILLQIGAIILSIRMLYGGTFNRFTGYLGILTHGLDLLHIIFLMIIPSVGLMVMAIGGTLYLLWLPVVGIRMLQINQRTLEIKIN
jgi:hypothetical protein